MTHLRPRGYPHPSALLGLLSLLVFGTGTLAPALAQDDWRDELLRLERPSSERQLPTTDLGSTTSLQTSAALLSSGLDLSLLLSVPAGEATSESIGIGLVDALERALEHNLGPRIQQMVVAERAAEQWKTRSRLLPQIEAVLERSRDEFNFEAGAFSRFRPPGMEDAEPVVGFDLFDARLEARWTLFDRPSRLHLKAARSRHRAAEGSLSVVRSSLVLLAGNLYYRVALLERRRQLAEQQLAEASGFYAATRDAAISGLRTPTDERAAQLAQLRAEQSLVVLRAEHQKAKLRLARAIGLPLGQPFHLLDEVRYTPLRDLDLESAKQEAFAARGDLRAVREKLEAARAERSAARLGRLPRLELFADVGEIGPQFSDRRETHGFGAELRFPLFRGGEQTAESRAAQAQVSRIEQELTALEASVHYELAEGLIDVETADRAVHLARRGRELAEVTMTETNDRFRAGVATTYDVQQARTALSSAHDQELDALLAHRTAKGAIARAMGLGEEQIFSILREELGRPGPRTEKPDD